MQQRGALLSSLASCAQFIRAPQLMGQRSFRRVAAREVVCQKSTLGLVSTAAGLRHLLNSDGPSISGVRMCGEGF